MAEIKVKHINQEFSLADGDVLYLDIPYPVRFLIGAVSADITMSVQVITNGSYRDVSPVITSGEASISSQIFPPKTKYKFSGGASEVKIYGV